MARVVLIPSSDFDSLVDALQAFADLAPSLEAGVRKLLFQVINRLPNVLHFVAEGVGVDSDGLSTTAANDMRIGVGFKLPDRYRSFMTALGARNVEVAVKHAALL